MSVAPNPALAKLLHEHQTCIALADQLLIIAADGSEDAVDQAAAYIHNYNDAELEPHLQHEEQTIFAPLLQEHREHLALIVQLGQEHGRLRTLAEQVMQNNKRRNVIEFAELLKKHSILEDEHVFPLVDKLLTQQQLAAIKNFNPLAKRPYLPENNPLLKTSTATHQAWLNAVTQHFAQHGLTGGHVVLFPRYQPELMQVLAKHLGLSFVDYQKLVMEPLREQAEFIELSALSETLQHLSSQQGFVCHNVEALLCVKPETERRAWLESFLNTAWPQPIVVPLTIYQAEIPENHPHICDLELIKIPRHLPQA
ncbi:hemerythrin domain-containing protein [Thiolinea disciformis]|uniref:hemerythrin domain-containing protein n=1 Tax=Thiolinea disciformis TaxID=125614 RepID=UPI000366FEBA|nr:hemerythrin domain-containing protein [Thiolinea disciformis]